MARDGLLTVHKDRRILLSEKGEQLAVQVMRRHRLAERLLVDVIGLPWAQAHEEACKWEHVISDQVEVKLVELLEDPDNSVYGTPIPHLSAPVQESISRFLSGVELLSSVMEPEQIMKVRLVRIGEFLQRDTETLEVLVSAGILPGAEIEVKTAPTCLFLLSETHECCLDIDWANQIFIQRT